MYISEHNILEVVMFPDCELLFTVLHEDIAMLFHKDRDRAYCSLERIVLGRVSNLAHFIPHDVKLLREGEFFTLVLRGIAIQKEGVDVDVWVDILAWNEEHQISLREEYRPDHFFNLSPDNENIQNRSLRYWLGITDLALV